MITPTIALAFSAGMVATFNPCGFALLPTYIGSFVAGDDTASGTSRILRAAEVSVAMAAAFVFVFSTVGLVLGQVASSLAEYLPWITVAIGLALVAGGVWLLAGRSLGIRLPRPSTPRGSGFVGVFSYGVTFAVASISCTIGPFLAITGAAVSDSLVERLGAYASYGLGMATVVALLTIAASFAQRSIATGLRSFTEYSSRIGGLLMIAAGGYAAWYGRWELQVYSGNYGSDPLITQGEDLRSTIVTWVTNIGSGPLIIAATVLVVGATAKAVWEKPSARGSVGTGRSTQTKRRVDS